MSFIPPKCTGCGGSLSRMTSVNSDLICLESDCKAQFVLLRKWDDGLQ